MDRGDSIEWRTAGQSPVTEGTAFPVVTFPSELSPATRKALVDILSQLEGFLAKAGFTATGDFVQSFVQTLGVGDLTVNTIDAGTIVAVTETLTTLIAQLVKTQALAMTPQNSYAVAIGDAALLASEAYTVWTLTASGDYTINGIYVADLTTGAPGHVRILRNTSGKTLTFQSAVVTNARRIYGCTVPVSVADGGCICFIYDTANLGWRYAWSSPGSKISYTPVWTGAGSNPVLNNGTLTGEWSQIGPLVFFSIILTAGSTTTFGTGAWAFTLPASASSGQGAAQTYNGTYAPAFWTVATATTIQVYSGAALDATTPFAWGTGDVLWITGFFVRA